MKETSVYDKLTEYCLKKDGAYLDMPFGVDYLVIKLKKGEKSRIFAEIFELNGQLKLTFSTDESTAELLRMTYPDSIVMGWHCPPVQAKYKSTATVQDFSTLELFRFIDLSYERCVEKLKF